MQWYLIVVFVLFVFFVDEMIFLGSRVMYASVPTPSYFVVRLSTTGWNIGQ